MSLSLENRVKSSWLNSTAPVDKEAIMNTTKRDLGDWKRRGVDLAPTIKRVGLQFLVEHDDPELRLQLIALGLLKS